MSFRWVERDGSSDLVLRFLIWSVASILTMRLYIYFSPMKQVAFGQWHIAHMLWGGLFMLIGFLLIIAYSGRRILNLAVILEGIGWGLFIDEIGKFLTKDNDYWFKPAIIFIYVSFILLFLLYRYLDKQRKKSVESYFFRLIDGLEEIINGDLENKERLYYLRKASHIIKNDSVGYFATISTSIKKVLEQYKTIEDKRDFVGFIKTQLSRFVERLSQLKLVRLALWFYTIYWSLSKFFDVVVILSSHQKFEQIQRYFNDYDFIGNVDLYMISFKMLSDTLASIFFIIGSSLFWTRKRKQGLKYYKNGLLISIFLSSIFRFYFEQFSGVIDLFLSMIIFYLLSSYNKQLNRNG